ncbi:MAG: hypothetical protein IPM22_19560 [Betaproteobacteria bacterium]|nr:hypothetical protein [Betaproteobacteria bacterium]MCC7219009.1 hypothetical protein [Burkholderiales bacterium]
MSTFHASARRLRAASAACAAAALLATAVALPTSAFAGGSAKFVLGPPGNPETVTRHYGAGVFSDLLSYQSSSGPVFSVEMYLIGRPDGKTGAKAFVSANAATIAQVAVTNVLQRYTLQPPAGASFAGGRLVLYAALAGADVRDHGTLDLGLDVRAYRGASWEARNSGQRTVDDQAGSEEVEFAVVVDLPATLDSAQSVSVDMTMSLTATANIPPSGGAVQFSIADAYYGGGRVAAFRVLNAAGAQVTGFKLSAGGSSIEERLPPPSGQVRAIEYFHPAFDHYFVTANADEIAKLDAGVISGWQRTGQSFNVYATSGSGHPAVCRFFSEAFAPKSSHFYAPRGLGCEPVFADPAWKYEGDVFYMPLPDAAGDCPAGTLPVYRLYNNGMGGAPNHRFTTSAETFAEMKRDGYIAEGAGVGVGMCSPE